MSLVKKLTMTEKKIGANRLNGSLSRGPVTAEGKERSAAAHRRHGLYAGAQDAALRCLGEDAARFEELLAGLYQEFTPSHADALLMRRIQDANLREVRRLTNLLLKLKQREDKAEALETTDGGAEAHDVIENTGA